MARLERKKHLKTEQQRRKGKKKKEKKVLDQDTGQVLSILSRVATECARDVPPATPHPGHQCPHVHGTGLTSSHPLDTYVQWDGKEKPILGARPPFLSFMYTQKTKKQNTVVRKGEKGG